MKRYIVKARKVVRMDEIPEWATHVADIRPDMEDDGMNWVKLLQYCPINRLKDLPEEMRKRNEHGTRLLRYLR